MAGSENMESKAYLAGYKDYSLKRSPAVAGSYLQRIVAWFPYLAAPAFGPFSWIAVPQGFLPLRPS